MQGGPAHEQCRQHLGQVTGARTARLWQLVLDAYQPDSMKASLPDNTEDCSSSGRLCGQGVVGSIGAPFAASMNGTYELN